MVMAQSLFKRLRELAADCLIDVIAPPWSLPLLERMPEVNQGIPLPIGHGQLMLKERRRIGRSLRANAYDQAIVLPNSLKSALVPFWADIPRRTGFVGEMRYGLLNDRRTLDKQALPKTVLRFLHLADSAGAEPPSRIPTPELVVNADKAREAMEKLDLNDDSDRPVLGLCPGAEYGPAKRWPEEHFAALSVQAEARGWRVWLFGSDKDHPVGTEITRKAPGAINLCGRTSLAEAIDLLSVTDAVVSNDSGLMHVAAALGRPLVALYGSSDPGFTPPLGDNHRILDLQLECSPCFKRECPLGHLDCLKGITPSSVDDALLGLLGSRWVV